MKCEEAEIHISAIMQDFRNSEKKRNLKKITKKKKMALCETLHLVLYSRSSHFALPELSKYYKIQNGR